MNRRDFMVAASGVAGATAAAAVATAGTPVAAQEDEEADGDPEEEGADTEENGGEETADEEGAGDGEAGNESDGGAGGGGGTENVEIGDNYFEPGDLVIEPGTTVHWEWVGDVGHNIAPTSQPEEAGWEGHPEVQDSGEYEHTFDVEGTYEYVCEPHAPGMAGAIEVTADADAAAGGEVDIHDIGVPIQKHFVGIATFLAIFVSLVFTFYLLKYGESAHTSSPGRK